MLHEYIVSYIKSGTEMKRMQRLNRADNLRNCGFSDCSWLLRALIKKRAN